MRSLITVVTAPFFSTRTTIVFALPRGLKDDYCMPLKIILTSGKIAVDETVAQVLDPGRGRTEKGYFWAIARDDRPWGGTDPPAIALRCALPWLDGFSVMTT
jgi:Transposase IS66 family